MSMMCSRMLSFSPSPRVPRSPFSHWLPENPSLQRHLLGSTQTPPLRQAGSHLAANDMQKQKYVEMLKEVGSFTQLEIKDRGKVL